MVNSLLIGLEVPCHLEIWHLAQFEYAEFNDAVNFFCFRPEIPFLDKLGQNCQYCHSRWSLTARLIPMAVFTFFVLGWKDSFCANLVKTVKSASLSLNLAASIIRICGVQWCCSLFLFSTENTLFGQVWSELSILSV